MPAADRTAEYSEGTVRDGWRPALVVTIDTEADSMWDRPSSLEFKNSRNLHRLQSLFDEFDVIPTYLTTYEVASDAKSIEYLAAIADRGRAEIGAHLHPWSNPPYHRIAADEMRVHPYPHEYSVEIFEAKLEELGRILRTRTGVRPRSYRAGRWGFASHHATVLERLGYVVDTSVTPGVSWERHAGGGPNSGGPSFAGAPRIPYFLDAEDSTRVGTGTVLEVPVSIEWNRALPPTLERRVDRLRPYGTFLRSLRALRVLRPVWLRPYRRFSNRDLAGLCDRLLRKRRPVWNVMFHSSEAVAATSPYSRDEAALELWFEKLRTMLQIAHRSGVRPMSLSEFADRWRATSLGGVE